MSNLKHEKAKLNALIEKHGLSHKKVLEQSQKVDKLIVKEMKMINGCK